MPEKDALIATGIFLCIALAIVGLIMAAVHHVLPEVFGGILQFTGQLDVHRTKVFENDIVKYSTLPNTISTRELEPGSLTQVYEQLVGVGQVVWLQRYCAFNVTANEPDVFEGLDANLAVEVIGNTTDNPELNKEKASARETIPKQVNRCPS